MEKGKEKSRILIADDNEPNVELLEAYLAGLDIETAVAIDGQDTLNKVAAFKPHLYRGLQQRFQHDRVGNRKRHSGSLDGAGFPIHRPALSQSSV